MADIFAAENIQSNDINATAPVVNDINQNGERTGTPNGKINDGAVASALGDKINAQPQGQPSSVPPALPTSDPAAEASDAGAPAPDAQTPPPIMQPPAAPKDIFAEQGIAPPTLVDHNQNAMSAGVDIQNPVTPQAQAASSYVNDETAKWKNVAQTLFTPEEIKSFENNPIQFHELGRFLPTDKTAPAGGFHQLYDAMMATTVAQKKMAGEPITAGEDEELKNFLRPQAEMALRGFTGWAKTAYVGAQIPAFMVEYALTDGVGKIAETAAVKGATELGVHAAVTSAAGFAARTTTRLAFMPAQYAGLYGDIRVNDFMSITDKGQAILHEAQESPATAALKAVGYHAANVVGQELAPAMGEFVGKGMTVLKTPLVSAVNDLSPEIRQGIYDAFKTIQPNAQVSKVFTAAGWSGMIEQLGANRVAQVLHATTNLAANKDYTIDDYGREITPSWDQLKLEGGLIGIGGAIAASAHIATNLMVAKGMPVEKAVETVQNMTANEREQYANENLPTPKSAYPEAPEPSHEYNPAVAPPDRSIVEAQHIKEIMNTEASSFDRNNPAHVQNVLGLSEKPQSALQFIKDQGGISLGLTAQEMANVKAARESKGISASKTSMAPEEIRSAFDGQEGRVGRLLNEKGNSIDTLHQKLTEAGYLPKKADAYDNLDNSNPQDVIDLIQKEAQGGKVYTQDVEQALADAHDTHNQNLDYFDQIGLHKDMSHEEIAQAMREMRTSIGEDPNQVYAVMSQDSGNSSVIKGQIDSKQAADPPPVQHAQSGFNAAWEGMKDIWHNQIYPEVWNDIQPIQNLSARAREAGATIPAGQDIKYLARMARNVTELIRYNQQVATAHFNDEGNMVETGKSLKSIRDDFDNMFLKTEPDLATRHDDLNKFEIAERFIDEHQKGEAYVSPAQLEQATAHMQYIVDKYGAESKFFHTFAQEEREWDNRILYNLVQSGLKSQKWYDDTTAKNTKYVPLQRIVEDEGYTPAVTVRGIGKDPNANKIGSIKQFKGSDLEVQNPLISRLKNSAQILQKSATNRALGNIAKFKDYYPEDVKVTNPRIIAQEVKVWYDPTLRSKLEAAVAHFGTKLERTAQVKMPDSNKDVGGYYSAMEKLIALKLGTGESPLTHEVGHMLDEHLKLGDKMLSDPQIKAELQNLALDRLSKTSTLEGEDELHFREELNKAGGKKYRDYIQNDHEVIANFYDAYVNSNEQARETAPKATAAFEKIVADDPKLAFLTEIKPSMARAEETIQKVIRDLDGKAGSFPFYENGSRKFLEMSDPLRKALAGLAPQELGMLEKLIGAPFRAAKRMLQFGATAMPSFVIRHFERNIEMAFLNSSGKATPLDIGKGVFDVLGRSEDYKKWAATSGKFETFMPLDEKSLTKSYAEMFGEKSKWTKFNPMAWHDKMKEFADQPARVATFNALKADGMSDMEAAFASIENLVDFGRHGSFTQKIARYAPFFNTIMQHGDVAVRAFAKNPAGYTARAMATIAIPQMVLTGYYLYAADDKTRNEYLEIPAWRKSLFSNIKIGDHWIPIPRAFAPGYIFGSIPEQIMLKTYGGYHPEAKNSWLQMMAGAANTVSPVFDWSNALNPLIKSVFENMTNYSFFMNRNVYNPDMKRLPPSQRMNTYTRETAKVLGDIFNFSPAMIDETIQNMGGNMGKFATQLGDKGINAVRGMEGKKVAQHPSDIVDNPIVGGLFERSPMGSSSESAQEFYNTYEAVSQKNNSLKNLEGNELSKYEQDNKADLSQFEMLKEAHKEISSLQKQSKNIYADENMPADQKEKLLTGLNEQITNVAKQANIQYTKATGER